MAARAGEREGEGRGPEASGPITRTDKSRQERAAVPLRSPEVHGTYTRAGPAEVVSGRRGAPSLSAQASLRAPWVSSRSRNQGLLVPSPPTPHLPGKAVPLAPNLNVWRWGWGKKGGADRDRERALGQSLMIPAH